MARVLNYGVSVVGLLVLVLGIKPLNDVLKASVPSLAEIPVNVFFIVGGLIIVIGLYTLRSPHKGKQLEEIPIYEGKEIVGYRRR